MLNNIFLKSAVSLIKIVALCLVAYFSLQIIFVKNEIQLAIGIFFIVFIALPTIFLIFFKKMCEVGHHTFFIKIWGIYRFFYAIFVVLFAIITIWGTVRINEQEKTQKTIDFINSKKITMDDVLGKNLPPKPDQILNDSTIAGIDVNQNYIRDDVELAIFEKYPNEAKIRAAMLQYAQALQLELTQVYSSETLIPVMQKENRGIDCIGQTGPEEKSMEGLKIINERKKEIEELILNTDLRKTSQLDNLEKYMTGYSSPAGEECDIDVK
jgi:hypothetical protein